ncbi:MAG: AIR synthase related protein, partial [Candidatus Micrarchaeia archaeon]
MAKKETQLAPPVEKPMQSSLTSDEQKEVRARLQRPPNLTEWSMLEVMWSEHCSYKSSKPFLKMFPTSNKYVVVGPGYDAGVVDIGDGWCATFKVESHNHPSAVDPYSGAATGVGGILRDILAMGGQPVALLDSIHFGSMKSGHSQWLLKNVVKGIGDYGNCVGVPTVAGEVQFDPTFEGNCIVNAACMGFVRKEKILFGKAKEAGDLLVMVGGSTGRDGIHGVTFASRNLTEGSDADRPAVQIPDPFTKKLIIDACLETFKTGKVKALKDLGG